MSARAGARLVQEPGILDATRTTARAMPSAAALKPSALLPQGRRAKSRFAAASPAAALRSAMEMRRLFILLPFALVLGLAAYAQLPFEPHPWALACVAAVLALFLALSLARINSLRGLLLLGAFWAGVCLLPIHGTLFGTPMLAFPVYGEYEAVVDEILSQTHEERRIIVSRLRAVGVTRDAGIVRARLTISPDPPLAPGDTIHAHLRLARVPGPILPGAFDGQFHAFFNGIGAYGNATSRLSLVAEGTNLDFTRMVEGLRKGIAARIDAVLDDDAAAIGTAMVVGDQSAITDGTREVMAASGLAHIYSISGLHLSIVAGGMFFLLRLAMAVAHDWTQTWPVKKIAAIGGIVTACGYLLLAGGLANVPALRSTIMLGLIFGAILAGRRALTMRNVAIAALAIIVIDPASVFRASFQLSFAAVVALIGVYELPRRPREGDQTWVRRQLRNIGVTALTSLIAGTATLLFSAYHFQQTAPLGVLGNVMVLPVVSFIVMPFALFSVLLMPFGIEGPFVAVMGWGIDRMVDGAELVTAWSVGLDTNPLLNTGALLIGLAALAWFAFVQNYWRFAGPILAIPAILAFGLDQRPDILIADTTQAIAVRSGEVMGLLTGKVETFAVDVWSDHYQEEIAPQLEAAACDSLACVVSTGTFSVAAIKSVEAFDEDCTRHDLVIARIRAPEACRSQVQVIDATTLAFGGVQWLKWDAAASEFVIRAAIPNLTRPWRAAPR
jgi:competence protein ComEC